MVGLDFDTVKAKWMRLRVRIIIKATLLVCLDVSIAYHVICKKLQLLIK